MPTSHAWLHLHGAELSTAAPDLALAWPSKTNDSTYQQVLDASMHACMQCLAEDSSTVYLEVELPRSCLLAKDHLSHRYHAKRALFLHHLGKKLQKSLQKRARAAANGTSPPDASVSFVAPSGNTRSPLLAFTDGETGSRVVLSARPAEDAFPAAKLAPDRNNLRTVRSAATAAAEQAAQDPGLSPTPRYNGSILADALRHGLCVELAAALPLPRQRDVARLLRLWLLAQVPRGVHAGPMLLGVLVALGMAVRAGQVVRVYALHVSVMHVELHRQGWHRCMRAQHTNLKNAPQPPPAGDAGQYQTGNAGCVCWG